MSLKLENSLNITVNPGALDRPIILNIENASVTNDYNEEIISYSTVNVMGNFQYMSGKEITTAGKETTYIRGRLVIREYPGLTVKDYVTVDSQDWDIETIGKYGKHGMYNLLYLRHKD